MCRVWLIFCRPGLVGVGVNDEQGEAFEVEESSRSAGFLCCVSWPIERGEAVARRLEEVIDFLMRASLVLVLAASAVASWAVLAGLLAVVFGWLP